MKLLTMDCRPKPIPTDRAPATMVNRSRLKPEIAEGDHAGGDDADIARRRADRVAQARIELGRGQEGVGRASAG